MTEENLICPIGPNRMRATLFVPRTSMLGIAKQESPGGGFMTPQELELYRKTQITEAAAPPASIDDVLPRESDYIFPVFRAVSKEVSWGWLLDMTRGDVLRDSAPLLLGQTVYPDHRWAIEGWLGVVSASEWDENGKIPGINVTMKIDWRANPKVARGLLMTPPALHSCSVTVLYEYEQSHTDLSERQFWEMLGEEVDGEIVRQIVTSILEYWEISIVFQGDFRSAKKLSQELKEFKSMMADRSPVSENISAIIPPEEKMEKEEVAQAVAPLKPFRNETLQLLNIEEAEPSIELIEASVLTLIESNNALKKQNEELQARAAIGDRYLADVRAEALRLAALVESPAGKLPEAVGQLISAANLDQAIGLKKMYEEKVEKLFPNTCQSCGSHKVERRSSIEQLETKTKTRETESDLSAYQLS